MNKEWINKRELEKLIDDKLAEIPSDGPCCPDDSSSCAYFDGQIFEYGEIK